MRIRLDRTVIAASLLIVLALMVSAPRHAYADGWSYKTWIDRMNDRRTCMISRTAIDFKTRRPVKSVQLAVRWTRGDGAPFTIVGSAASVPRAVVARVDKHPAVYAVCSGRACPFHRARLVVGQLRQGTNVAIRIHLYPEGVLDLDVPLPGFSDAYARVVRECAPKPQSVAVRAPKRRTAPLPDASLSLSRSEFDALRRQLSGCWNFPAGAKDAGSLVVEIKVVVNPDRTVREARIVDVARMRRDPYFRMAAESALRAIQNPRCSPLRLPPSKYRLWRSMTVEFDPREMLGG